MREAILTFNKTDIARMVANELTDMLKYHVDPSEIKVFVQNENLIQCTYIRKEQDAN